MPRQFQSRHASTFKILTSTAQLVGPLHSRENALASITLFPFGIVTHEQVKLHDDMLSMEILMLRLCTYF